MSIGFNHRIQIGLNIKNSINAIRLIRSKTQNNVSRLVLAQLEGLLNQYQSIEFQALSTPKDDSPAELIGIFDKLINDQSYIEYSNSISELTIPSNREVTLRNIQVLSRKIGSSNYISTGWDYLTKIIKVLSGVPLPESKAIASVIKGQNLPQLVDLTLAKNNALEMWKQSVNTNNPLRRDGKPLDSGEISWLPPLGSMKVRSEDNRTFSLGSVGELKNALEEFEKKMDKDE